MWAIELEFLMDSSELESHFVKKLQEKGERWRSPKKFFCPLNDVRFEYCPNLLPFKSLQHGFNTI